MRVGCASATKDQSALIKTEGEFHRRRREFFVFSGSVIYFGMANFIVYFCVFPTYYYD